MSGRLAMTPENVSATVGALGGVGQHLRDTWQQNSSRIDGSQSAIGSDVLGAAFRKVYEPDNQAVRREAPRVSGAIDEDGRIGKVCADQYVAADQKAKDDLARVGSR